MSDLSSISLTFIGLCNVGKETVLNLFLNISGRLSKSGSFGQAYLLPGCSVIYSYQYLSPILWKSNFHLTNPRNRQSIAQAGLQRAHGVEREQVRVSSLNVTYTMAADKGAKDPACEDAAVDKLTKGAVDDLIDEAWAACNRNRKGAKTAFHAFCSRRS